MPAQIKISDLPVATTVSDPTTAVLPIVDAGTTSQISVNNLASSAANDVSIFTNLRETTLVDTSSGPLSLGDNDLYTVPSGRCAIVGNCIFSNNALGASFTVYAEVKHGGTYYRASNNFTPTNNTSSLGTLFAGLVLESGDIFAANVTTTPGGYTVGTVIEYSASKSAIVPAHIFGTTTGDNTLYTCPAGKKAFPVAFNPVTGTLSRVNVGIGIGAVAPGSAGTKLVKSGGSPTIINQATSAITTTNGVSATTFAGCLSAGDSVVVTVGTGDPAHFVSGAFIEIDA